MISGSDARCRNAPALLSTSCASCLCNPFLFDSNFLKLSDASSTWSRFLAIDFAFCSVTVSLERMSLASINFSSS
eukprot:CAMPEP_0204064568 /NCGR_PEP_ID=MMETSP0360-20130528/148786_1 /ASSEMBLY_ACC=CAM_ASM_000342 /TAXON_ID=268821 /ORGANISM="Scrippsiella Hangoei, Strain SHTV-5" /LENGTH=74 /DNA_ID=CAMNT_0051012503 /DNA_START=453 /DNA_END=677 /DNA_ORIENTATION=-